MRVLYFDRKASIYLLIFCVFIFSLSLYPVENKKKLKRAIAECASIMAVSQTNYWLKYSNWIEDWQYGLNWEDQKERIFSLDGQKFDSNCFQTNWTHGLSGAMYYNFARTNGLNILESSAFTTLVSFYWEFIVEWREVISINDNIFTSFGGISLGESFFQLGSYFNGNKGFINSIAGILTNPIMAINRWLDRKKGYTYYTPNKSNMSFFLGNFFIMNDTNKPSKDRHHFLGFNSSLTYLPEIKKKGVINQIIKGTILSDINIKLEIKHKTIDEISGYTRNVYYGKYKQNIQKHDIDYVKGYSSLFSLSSGFDFYKKKAITENDSCMQYKYIDDSIFVETPTEFLDKLAIINMIGPYSELTYYFGKGKIKFMNTFSLDFGLVNAYALNKYSETEDISYTKATLYNYGYYYAFGYTFNHRTNVIYKNFTMNLEYKYQNYNSIEGFDRFENMIKNNHNINDIKSNLTFYVRYKLNTLPLGVKFIFEKRFRNGTLNNIVTSEKETRIYTGVEFYL